MISYIVSILLMAAQPQQHPTMSHRHSTNFTVFVNSSDKLTRLDNSKQEKEIPYGEQLKKYGWTCKISPMTLLDEINKIAQSATCVNSNGAAIATSVACNKDQEDSDTSGFLLDQITDQTISPVKIVLECSTKAILDI